MIQKENFWSDQEKAQSIIKEKNILEKRLNSFFSLENEFDELNDLTKITNDDDEKLLIEINKRTNELIKKVRKKEFESFLSGEADTNDCFLEVHSGAGGVEAQDWAQMIVRMYTRWCVRKGFGWQILDVSHGEESGIKSVVVQVAGEYAYGHLKAEKGVHRLVRISPFDNDHARHTSFALAEVIPRMEEGADIEINPDDLRVDVFRAGGHGGQSVQKKSTAIRITHEPTGIVVTCQNERSQRQNREIAMRILASRLADLERERKDREISDLKGDHISAEWGNQIRSYVLHPYQMVKDHRTDMETSATSEVLDGDIDMFIKAYLKYQMGT